MKHVLKILMVENSTVMQTNQKYQNNAMMTSLFLFPKTGLFGHMFIFYFLVWDNVTTADVAALSRP